MPKSNIPARRRKLAKTIKEQKADAMLITNFGNVSYLIGFSGDDSYLLVFPDATAWLISDSRYKVQIDDES